VNEELHAVNQGALAAQGTALGDEGEAVKGAAHQQIPLPIYGVTGDTVSG